MFLLLPSQEELNAVGMRVDLFQYGDFFQLFLPVGGASKGASGSFDGVKLSVILGPDFKHFSETPFAYLRLHFEALIQILEFVFVIVARGESPSRLRQRRMRVLEGDDGGAVEPRPGEDARLRRQRFYRR